MKKSNAIWKVFLFILLGAIFFPIIILYGLEDKNWEYLNRVSKEMMNGGDFQYNHAVINTVYAKYNETKYNVSTSDAFEYSVSDKVIDGNHYLNYSLVKLKELESIGLLKNDFFLFVASNKQVITRTNIFRGENLNYSKKRLFLSNDNYKTAFMSFELENVTEKIIGFKVPGEYIVNEQEAFTNYIKYLDLESEDWVYHTNSITSKSRKIEIQIENMPGFISISIVPYS